MPPHAERGEDLPPADDRALGEGSSHGPCVSFSDVRDAILTRLVALGAEARLARAAKLERQLRELERELAEVRQLIPAWSRVFFFVESADERREKELKAQIASARADLDRTRGELRADLEAVATELPPF